MAVLSKIRQRSLLLILVIGFCLLAFIIGDIINSGGFGVSRNIGSVNGKDIPVQDFLQKVNDATQNQPGLSPTAASNAVWNREVDNILFADKIEQAGIRVGRDHVIGAYARNPQVAMNPQFQNALGKFDRNKFNQFLADTKTNNPALWQNIERNQPLVEEEAKKNIYINMIKAGMIATAAEGKAKYHEENDKATFDYVYVPYSTINDDEVKVSDEEIIEFMKKNEKKYKAEESRDVEFVMIENKPSVEDEAEMKTKINAMLAPRIEYNDVTKTNDTVPGFAQASNVEEFVNANSAIRFDSTYVTKKQLPLEHSEQIYNLAPGQVYGPYIDNGYYKLTRVIKRKSGANSNVTHVLVAYKGALNAAPTVTRTKEEAKALANSYLAQINSNPAVIGQLARSNSDDPGSVSTGGTYDVTPEAGMVQPFKDFALNNPSGKTGVVETDFGFHVMKINSKEDAVQLATVAQAIQPSEATSDAIFTKASKFEMDAAEKPFADLAKELNLTVTPANKLLVNDEMVPGVGNNREIVRWAFSKDAKEGDVKKFDIPQGHVIVRLKNKNEKGLLPIEEAKQVVLPIIRDQKKADKIRQKMAGNTLEEVSQKSGAAVATATDVTFAAPLVPNVGPEPKVVGTVFGLANGKTSKLIDGKMGVFMVRAKGVTKAAELPNYTSLVSRLRTEARNSVQSRLSAALKDNADIEDKRADFN